MQAIPGRFRVWYHLFPQKGQSVDAMAGAIALEQTVETPRIALPPKLIDAGMTGRVETVRPLSARERTSCQGFAVCISYRDDLIAGSLSQTLNLLFGNISLQPHIRVVDVELSEDLYGSFGGPGFGVDGVRQRCGVFGRPLTATALKPMGLTIEELAQRAALFAGAGIDIIKDDHGLGNQPFHPFYERVARCQEAVVNAGHPRGTTSLYFPMLSCRTDQVESCMQRLCALGIQGVMVAPGLTGWDTLRQVSRTYGMMVLAHPALLGTYLINPTAGLAPQLLLGTLLRMAGADAVIFPSWGGRFGFSRKECGAIARALQTKRGDWKAVLPTPAGGMQLQNLEEQVSLYGRDSLLLVGGALLTSAGGPARAAAAFVDRVRALFGEQRLPIPSTGPSTCDLPGPAAAEKPRTLLPQQRFCWAGRRVQAYKPDGDFAGITRQELFGRNGESTAFDLRYFEIGPGGFSSREKHVHEHVVIGACGRGVLVIGESEEYPVAPFDCARVAPWQVHQLKNTGSEPFGFFCIVDHDRDRPQTV